MTARTASYETVPYPGHAYPQTHPDRLATVATLFGMAPAAVQRCRVLEIGCGDGINLLAMAQTLPDARFVGVDMSAAAIQRGSAYASELGLANLALEQMDLRQLPEQLGLFDYIIAHGLYSWVPADVRDCLMALVRRHLAPAGVAFISYSAYPGAYARRMLREMMLYHVGDMEDPHARARQAVAFAAALARATRDADDEMGGLLSAAVKRLAGVQSAPLLHDDLADVHDPVYFHEFARHASAHGLQFLAEADLSEMGDEAVPDDLRPQLRALADTGETIRREQLLDFFKGRQFRQTLLCHHDREVDRAGASRRVQRLLASAALVPVASDEYATPDTVRYTGSRGSSVATADPLTKAALAVLAERYPARVDFNALLASACARAPEPPASSAADRVAEMLWQCANAGVVELHTVPAPLTAAAGPRPETSALARLQVREQADVTSLVHRTVRIADAPVRALLPLLDGTRDRPVLLAAWSTILDATIAGDPDRAGGRREQSEAERQAMLDECLAGLGRMALLVR